MFAGLPMECTRHFVGVMGWVESNPAGSFYGTFFLCQGYLYLGGVGYEPCIIP